MWVKISLGGSEGGGGGGGAFVTNIKEYILHYITSIFYTSNIRLMKYYQMSSKFCMHLYIFEHCRVNKAKDNKKITGTLEINF